MTFNPKDIRYLPEDTQFREDVRAVLPVFLKRAYELMDSGKEHSDVSSFDAARWAVDFVEELHKQLKEKGRI